jgi:hypothetical protein
LLHQGDIQAVLLCQQHHVRSVNAGDLKDLVMCSLFAGFTISPPLMPNYIRWISYLNPVYWTLFSMMTTQFGDSDAVIFNTLIGKTQTVPEYIDTTFGWTYGQRWWAFFMIWAFNIVFMLLFTFGLARINHTKR